MTNLTPYTLITCECGEPVPLTLNYEHQGRRLCSSDCFDNATRREASRGEYQTDQGPSTQRLRQGLQALAKDWLDTAWNPRDNSAADRLPTLLQWGATLTAEIENPTPVQIFRAMLDRIRTGDRACVQIWAAEASA